MPFRAGEILILTEEASGCSLTLGSAIGDRFVVVAERDPMTDCIRVRREDNETRWGQHEGNVLERRFRSTGQFVGQHPVPENQEGAVEKYVLLCRRQGGNRWDVISQMFPTYNAAVSRANTNGFEYHIIPVRSVTHVAVGGQVTDYRNAV
jgi:hypothetical protein